MFLSREDARAICERLLSNSRADGCEIEISGGAEQNLRFARGEATTNAALARVSFRISSHVDRRIGSVSVSSLEESELLAALSRSEAIARSLPQDPDYVAPLGPQNYSAASRYDEGTAALRLNDLADWARLVIEEGERRSVETFGCAAAGRRFHALATSEGLFAYDRVSEAEMSATARDKADGWSGWAGDNQFFVSRFDAAEVARRACEKAAQAAPPRDLEPGEYTVVFEPAAVAELAHWLVSSLNARAADEGRSFFSGKGGGTRLFERLFDEKLTIRSDPGDALAPESPIGQEGVPHRPRLWIDRGALTSLYRARAYAQRVGDEAVPHPRSFRMEGGQASLADMIGSVRRGVLVTRLWYSNMLDPRGLLLTGLTRDGNFLIENGKLAGPARNMRFNQSLAHLFARIEALGPSERTWSAIRDEGAAAAPPMLVEKFCFSSRSSGV
ncbi:TldD/PmbA family protein [Methylocystis heyeri]|uniref:TldD/PmbA family protein n=1 Tax=Methylocystis heyeri TaxID=391905 RepID=A0A6B8KIT6_9HYPH|nr:metallopeptidase TldD-related protein [Methylocystis heyeri]QGM46438.1 TldD/PmbA family protein [Methylocystis heyeri]